MAVSHRPQDRPSPDLSFTQIQAELARAEQILLTRPKDRRRFDLIGFHLFFPNEPGVYCIFLKDELVYVGESGDLRGRMKDLCQTRNHTFRRSYGKHLFKDRAGFIPATNKKCFDAPLETELNQHMSRDIFICCMVVHFGRCEIEEHIIANHRPMFCAKGRRGEKC